MWTCGYFWLFMSIAKKRTHQAASLDESRLVDTLMDNQSLVYVGGVLNIRSETLVTLLLFFSHDFNMFPWASRPNPFGISHSPQAKALSILGSVLFLGAQVFHIIKGILYWHKIFFGGSKIPNHLMLPFPRQHRTWFPTLKGETRSPTTCRQVLGHRPPDKQPWLPRTSLSSS